MLWEPTELESHTTHGTYLLYRAGDAWIARFRPSASRSGGRGVAIEPEHEHWPAAAPAQAACAMHHGRMQGHGDTAEQAATWVRRHCEYLLTGQVGT